MPLPLLAAGIAAAGSALGHLTDLSAVRRRNSLLTQGARSQSIAGMESANTMGDFITQLRNAQVSPGAERTAFNAAAGAPTVSGPMTASSQFRNDAATATTGARGYGAQLADIMSRVRAPQLQRQREGEIMMEAGNTLRPIQARAEDSEFLTNLRTGGVQANPWAKLGGSLLQQGGKYLAKGK